MIETPKNPSASREKPALVNLEQLAKAIDRTPQQMGREAKRDGFPTHYVGRQKLYAVDEVIRWRADNIRGRKEDPTPAPAPVTIDLPGDDDGHVNAPGKPVTVADVMDASSPFGVAGWIGTSLYGELTTDDLQSLAGHYTYMMIVELEKVAIANGATGLLASAPPEYYGNLFARIPRPALENAMRTALVCWAARRFIDRPRWWKELSEPTDDPKPSFFENLKPLAHRMTSNAAAKSPRTSARESTIQRTPTPEGT